MIGFVDTMPVRSPDYRPGNRGAREDKIVWVDGSYLKDSRGRLQSPGKGRIDQMIKDEDKDEARQLVNSTVYNPGSTNMILTFNSKDDLIAHSRSVLKKKAVTVLEIDIRGLSYRGLDSLGSYLEESWPDGQVIRCSIRKNGRLKSMPYRERL